MYIPRDLVDTNLYNLKVEFENGFKWDLDIEAVHAEAVTTWIRSDMELKSVSITLIKKNFDKKQKNFLARSFKDNT